MNDLAAQQNTPQFQRLLKARLRIYEMAGRYQVAQLVLSVLVPLIGAGLVVFVPEDRPAVALIALGITIVNAILIDRGMKTTLRLAARVTEQFDCDLFKLSWNSFVAGKHAAPDEITSHAESWSGPAERIIDWYPVAAGEPPLEIGTLICQLTNLWYDAELRRTYFIWLASVLFVAAAIYSIIGKFQGLEVGAWAYNATIAAPIIIWMVREFYRQKDTADAIASIKSNAECLWDDALAGKWNAVDLKVQSREFQNAIFTRRANNPPHLPRVYKLRRPSMEVNMNAIARDRLKAYLASHYHSMTTSNGGL